MINYPINRGNFSGSFVFMEYLNSIIFFQQLSGVIIRTVGYKEYF